MKKIILVSFLFIVGCSEGDISDLEGYVHDIIEKPRGRIKPLPEFKPYSAFSYSASALRSPFESPVAFEEAAGLSVESVAPPDFNRAKQALENYAISDLKFVGSLAMSDTELKALIKIPGGSVQMVNKGDFIGKNFGRITEVNESRIEITEIVPNGSDGWMSRPQTMGINESSEAKN